MEFDHPVSCRNELVRDAYHAGPARIESVWCRNIDTYCYNTYRVFRADELQESISCRDEIVSYRIVSKRTRAGCISNCTNTNWVFGAETWIHIVTIHIECFVQTNDMTAYHLEMKLFHTVSCRNELMRDAHNAGQRRIESVWCGNMNTYCYNTCRVFRAEKWHDSISSRDETLSNRIVSKRTRAGCISCRKHKYWVFGAVL